MLRESCIFSKLPINCHCAIRITEYDACDRLSGEIQRQIMQRKAQPVNGPEYSRLSGIVRLRMKQYGNELSQLSQKIRGAQLLVLCVLP